MLPEGLPLSRAMDKFADTDGDGVVTNFEFYLALDPNNVRGIDYVFNNFKWDHCNFDTTADATSSVKENTTPEEAFSSVVANNAVYSW